MTARSWNTHSVCAHSSRRKAFLRCVCSVAQTLPTTARGGRCTQSLPPSSRPRACSLHPTYAPRDTAWVFRRRAAAMWRICGDALDLDLSADGGALPTGIGGTTAARRACDEGIIDLSGHPG